MAVIYIFVYGLRYDHLVIVQKTEEGIHPVGSKLVSYMNKLPHIGIILLISGYVS